MEAGCGRGLAERSVLAAALARLTAAMAGVLENHQRSLDLGDANAKKEHEAYVKLTSEFREIAELLNATAGHMAGYRDLPPARHDEKVLSSSKSVEVFATFVESERQLMQQLEESLTRDQTMLDQMRGR